MEMAPLRKFLHPLAAGLLSICVALLWSAKLLTEWGNDFGLYYANARYFSKDFRLYKEAFDAKGPAYYFFNEIIGAVIGWGSTQAWITLSATVALFLWSCWISGSLVGGRRDAQWICLTVGGALLYAQSTNASMPIFQAAVSIFGVYYIASSFEIRPDSNMDGNANLSLTFRFYVGVVFLSLSFLTRFDGITYSLLPVFALFLYLKSDLKNKRIIIFRIIISLALFIVMFFFFMVHYSYSFIEFWIHNVNYTFYHAQHFSRRGHIFKWDQLIAISVAGLTTLLATCLVLWQVRRGRDAGTRISSSPKGSFLLFSFWVCLLSWIITRGDMPHHVFIVIPGLICLTAYLLPNAIEMLASRRLIVLICLYFIYVTVGAADEGINALRFKSDPFDPLSSPTSIRYQSTLDLMKGPDKIVVIGGRGWLFLFSGAKPDGAIYDFPLYENPVFTTEGLLLRHKQLLNQINGYKFFIDRSLVESSDRSKYLDEIMAISKEISRDDKYVYMEISL